MTWIQFLKPKRLPFSSGDYTKYKHTSVMVKKDNNHYFCQRKSHPFRLVETFSWHPQHLAFWGAFSRTHRSTSWFWKAPWITPLAPRAKGHHTPWHPWASICYSINIKLATKPFFSPRLSLSSSLLHSESSLHVQTQAEVFSPSSDRHNGLADVKCKYLSPEPSCGKLFQYFSIALNRIFSELPLCEKSENWIMFLRYI